MRQHLRVIATAGGPTKSATKVSFQFSQKSHPSNPMMVSESLKSTEITLVAAPVTCRTSKVNFEMRLPPV